MSAGEAVLAAVLRDGGNDNDATRSARLNDISFGQPVNAALVVIAGVHCLVWSRSTHKAD